MNKANVGNYDPIAPMYMQLERLAFGQAMAEARFYFLNVLRGKTSILLVGEGDGRFLSSLLKRRSLADITVIDNSFKMTELTRDAMGKAPLGLSNNVHLICSDARFHAYPKEHFDAIVSNYFLDNFHQQDLIPLVAKLTNSLKEGGSWINVDFQIPDSGLKRLRAKLWIWLLYRFFRLTTRISAKRLEPTDVIFRSHYLQLKEKETFRGGLIKAELWQKCFPKTVAVAVEETPIDLDSYDLESEWEEDGVSEGV